MSLQSFLIDWFFPAKCLGCATPHTWWCQQCHTRTIWFTASRCQVCQRLQESTRCCLACRRKTGLNGVVSVGRYSKALRQAVTSLKFRSSYAGWDSLSVECIGAIQKIPYTTDLVLVPVPLSAERVRLRGYNQAKHFATMLSRWTGLTMNTGLERSRNTQPQSSLDRRHRRENVVEAFSWDGEVPKQAVLVDDVATTFSTLSECAATLRRAGCLHVWAITLARA